MVRWRRLPPGGPLSFGAGPFFAAGSDGILRIYRLTQPPSESEDAP